VQVLLLLKLLQKKALIYGGQVLKET